MLTLLLAAGIAYIITKSIAKYRNTATLFFRTTFKVGYTEGVIYDIAIDENVYFLPVTISHNKLFGTIISNDKSYVEKVNIVPYESSKPNKKEILRMLSIEKHSFSYSIRKQRNQL